MNTTHAKNNPPERPARRLATFHKIGLGLMCFFIVTLVGTQFFLHQTSVGSDKFVPGTVILMGLTLLVVVLILILGFVLSRNVVKLYFERRSKLLGSRFKTRLLVAFGALSLAPAMLQMFLAYTLISKSIDQWFSAPAKQMLDNSVTLADSYYVEITSRASAFARSLAPALTQQLTPGNTQADVLSRAGVARLVSSRLADFPEARVRVYDGHWRLLESSADFQSRPEQIELALRSALEGREYSRTETGALVHDVLLCAVPVRQDNGAIAAAVLVERFIPQSIAFKAHSMREAYEKYAALKARNFEFRWTYLLVLTLATGMILFGFSWFAIYVAKRITVPIQALAEGAEQVAAGRLDYRVQCETSDEVQNLVDSFNRMIEELEQNRRQINLTYQELQRSSVESEEHRRYIETLLENVPSCVISTDANFRITTVNRAAAEILHIRKDSAVGQELKEAVDPGLASSLKGLAQRAQFSGQAVREIEWSDGQTTLHLAASLNYLQDTQGKNSGAIILLDDLTELINAEKMAAWQEVARRLAHEIRNPLTPIQLSAERIRRHTGMAVVAAAETASGSKPPLNTQPVASIIDEGTRLIIQEARSLKRLVDEFSRFARMPAHRPVVVDINKVIESALLLYEGRLKDVRIVRALEENLPALRVDTEQMKRVFVNLFDNALAAMADADGEHQLTVTTRYFKRQGRVRIEVADTGCGISRADRENLFLPYFSRRRKGTGLGLTIVKQIVTDHEGRIRAEDNRPRGIRMIIDLPVESATAVASPRGEVAAANFSPPWPPR